MKIWVVQIYIDLPDYKVLLLMSLARKISQNLIWRGLYLSSMLLSNILFARVLGANDSGAFFYIVNNVSLLILVAGFCLETSFVYFGSSQKIETGKLVVAGLTWSLFAGIAGWVFGLFAIPPGSFQYPGGLWVLFAISFVLINYFSALYNTKDDFKTYNIILVLINLVFILGLFIIDFIPQIVTKINSSVQPDISGWVTLGYIYTVILQGVIITVSWFIKNPTLRFNWPNKSDWVLLIKYALLSLSANIIFFLVYRIDYWFVNYFQQGDQLGNYIQVSKLGQLFIILPSMIAAVIFPATAQDLHSDVKNEMLRLCRIFFSAYLVIFLLLSFTGFWLFTWIFGPSFNQMYSAFAALSPGIIALSLQSLLAAWFAGKNKVRYNVYGALVALLLIIVFDLLLIPKYGINGAAVASSIGYIAYCAFSFYLLRKEDLFEGEISLIVNKTDIRWLKNVLNFNLPKT